jgi:hypothetical protein
MEFGKIESLDIRTYWRNEESEFTPWLAKNAHIQVLGEAIGLDLEVEGTEVPIGSFKADILARDGDGRKVIVENQLGKTDHKHLGQLITYASGIDAQIIIWVCREVTDEHRRAVDWLNEVTTSEIAFFACEIALWQIDDSRPAPRFNVIASPNDWSKTVKSGPAPGSLSPTKAAHLEFWNAFKEYMTNAGSDLRLRTPRPQHWYSIAVGRSKFHLSLTTNTQAKRVGCELYIRGALAKSAFSQLHKDKEPIEATLGKLEWQELPDGQDCRIIQYRDGDSKNRSQWPQLHEWLKDRAEKFSAVFGPRVKALNLEETDGA